MPCEGSVARCSRSWRSTGVWTAGLRTLLLKLHATAFESANNLATIRRRLEAELDATSLVEKVLATSQLHLRASNDSLPLHLHICISAQAELLW